MQAVATMPSLVSNEHFQLCALDAPPAVEDTRPPALPELRARFAELSEVYELPDKPVEEFISWMPELCVAFHSRQFQVAGDTFDDRCVFVGPCLADSAASDWTPPAGAGPVVLISLGTSHNDRPEFFTTCVAAFRDTPWHVVLTLGAHGDPDALGELPPNIEAHRWIPHLSVLRYAKACVCQAGMGSTMEALYSGVPLITVPQAVDAEPIAARVADLGVGLLVPPSEVTAERLRDAVAEVVSDEGIAARMREVRQGVREAGGARRAVDEIESLLYTGQR
jgi:dTDP-L-oleandrosyltransferase